MEEVKDKALSLHRFDIRSNRDAPFALLHPDFAEITYSGHRCDFAEVIHALTAAPINVREERASVQFGRKIFNLCTIRGNACS